ncbi:MAG TPA: hypothetical protein PK719_05055, partial [Bacteroidales bacterium]|nr:hypothetical protein [Bacteroidales bacterium]
MKQEISVFLLLFVSLNIMAQNNKDRAIFRESKPGFYQNYILRDDLEMKERKDQASATRSFAMDLSSASLPNKIELYKNK